MAEKKVNANETKNKFGEFVGTHIWKIMTVVFFFLFLGKGCTNNKISDLNDEFKANKTELVKYIDAAQKTTDSAITTKEVKDIVEKVMLDFLIYEDDLDKGKISLSEVKDKIEANDMD